MNFPKISIVTPVFNSAATLEKTIRSVVEQRYPNCEYIIIDGDSDDGTKKIIERFKSELSFWCSEPDNGQYDAINKGFARATGDILCWINADDMYLPKALWIIGEIFGQYPEIEWVSTLKPGGWDANGYFTGTKNIPGFSKRAFVDGLYLPGSMAKGHWIQQESTFWRNSLWEKVGCKIPERYGLAGDFALWADFYKHAELYGVAYPIAGFRSILGQRSEDIAEYLREAGACLFTLQDGRSNRNFLSDVRSSFLADTPLFKKILRRLVGYHGCQIVNNNGRIASSGWRVVRHRFLP